MNTTIKARNRILSLVLALCLLLAMAGYLPGPVEVYAAGTEIKVNTLTGNTSGADWNYDHSLKALFLTGPVPFVLTGTNAAFSVVVGTPVVEITLRDVQITAVGTYVHALSCEGNTVILTLEGSNFLQGNSAYANSGIHVTDAASLTITGSGFLEAKGVGFAPSPGIGTADGGSANAGEITITGNARVTAIGAGGGAGIGGGNVVGGGAVTITGNARVTATGSDGSL